MPQPLASSRPMLQRLQPSAVVMSSAERSRIASTWSACRPGLAAISSAAAADTCAAANDVPSPWRKSSGPQLE